MDDSRADSNCGTPLINDFTRGTLGKEGGGAKTRAESILEPEEKQASTGEPGTKNSMPKGKTVSADLKRKRKDGFGLEDDGVRSQTPGSSSLSLASSSSSFPTTFESSSNVNVVEGDLVAPRKAVNDGKELIVHQTNCITQRGKGLAKVIFSRYPSANCYKKRRKRGAMADIPGTIQHVKFTPVVNLFGQFNPGKPRKRGTDTKQLRLEYFRSGLEATLNLPFKRVSLPWQIGCGLAGGSWPEYLKIIHQLAKAHPEKTITIFKLPRHKMKMFKKSLKSR